MLVGGSPGCADGVNGDQLQLSPPLVMTEAQIDDAVGMLAAAIETAHAEVAAEAEVAAVAG
jgi:adenosylmethionine-8-amino-7-oxononanoate aminotransferase